MATGAGRVALWLGIAFVAVVVTACAADVGGGAGDSSTSVESGRFGILRSSEQLVELCLEIADEPDELRVGLSNVDTIEPFDGMLFVFASPGNYAFWMKDTRIPLELVPIRPPDDASADSVDVGAGELGAPISMDPCTSGACPRYRPDFAYAQALELDDGRLASLGLVPAPGSPVEFSLGSECIPAAS